MRLSTTLGYAAAKAAHAEAYAVIAARTEGDPTKEEDDAEFAMLEAWMNHPAITVDEFKDKLAYAEQREMLYWTGWEEERAGIMRDLEVLARHPVSIQAEFAAWHTANEAHAQTTGDEGDEAANALCNASSNALRALFAAPCTTPGDFIVKAYANLLGECGSTNFGKNRDDGTGSYWDVSIAKADDPRDLNDAWCRSAYADLDGSDLGACLLAFGLIEFDPTRWVERANAVGLMAMLAEQEDGTRGLWLCEDVDFREPNDRIRMERERLRRIVAFDPVRVSHLCAEIERAWPNLIARRAA